MGVRSLHFVLLLLVVVLSGLPGCRKPAVVRREIDRLESDLKHVDGEARRFAAFMLGKYGPAAAECVPALADSCLDMEPKVREAAVEAIGRIGVQNDKAMQSFLIANRDRSEPVRIAVAKYIWVIAPEERRVEAMNALLVSAGDGSREVRAVTVQSLAAIEPRTDEIRYCLFHMLKDQDRSIAALAREALQQESPEEAVTAD